MKLTNITPETVKKLPDKELINMHRRCHQLYGVTKSANFPNKDHKELLIKTHNLIVKEMNRRGFKHNSPLK